MNREEKIRKVAAKREKKRRECERNLAEFTRAAWHLIEPGTKLVWNWHLDVICTYLEHFFRGDIKRLILNIPPGSMKSILLSVMGPAWVWTWRPESRFINLTNELGLATRDSLRMRQIIQSDWYQSRWEVNIAPDQREKMHFANDSQGFRQGLGLTGNITGKRGNFLLIDDPMDAKKAFSDVENQTCVDTYDQAVSSRLNDLENDGIALIMQRLRTDDLSGHLLTKKKQKWVHCRIPMEYEGVPAYNPVRDLGTQYTNLIDPRKDEGELMFPARFPQSVVDALKEDLGQFGSAGQLQQLPSPKGGGIIKRHYWRKWPKYKPLPTCLHIFASYDTAYSERDIKSAAYTARTTWGVFKDEINDRAAVILLECWHDRVGYPALRKIAKEHHREWDCDRLLIERKASGQSLLQDMRRLRIPICGYNPGKADKIERAHLITPVFEAGLVYYPDRQWAVDFIDHVTLFPTGPPPSADYTDTVTQACQYLKRGWWLTPPEEIDDTHEPIIDEDEIEREPSAAYG